MRQVEPELVAGAVNEDFPALIPTGHGQKMRRPQMADRKGGGCLPPVACDSEMSALHELESRNCHELPVPGSSPVDSSTGLCVLSGCFFRSMMGTVETDN